MPSVRRMTPADIDAAADFTARAFAPERVDQTAAALRLAYHGCPFMPIDLCYGLEENGQVIFQWQALDFTLRLGCAEVRAAGCFAIAAADAAANQGRNLLQCMNELGNHIPAELGFDVMVGFARNGRGFLNLPDAVPLGAEYRWTLPVPQTLPPKPGLRRADDSDVPALIDLYNHSTREQSCAILRRPNMWPWMLRKPPELWMGDGGYIGLRSSPGTLEVREVAGRSLAFYEQALAAILHMAQERGATEISGHLPPDHPLVQAGLQFGGEVHSSYSRTSGSFVGLMRPVPFMHKIAPELQRRWCRSLPHARLHLDVQCGDEHARLVLNPAGTHPAELQVEASNRALIQLCLGYAQPRTTLHHEHGRAAVIAGDLDLDIALTALFAQQHPFIAHTDRW